VCAVEQHQTGKFKEAEKSYRRLLEDGFQPAKIKNLLGTLSFQTGRPDEAIELFEDSLRLDPNDEDTYFNFGLVLDKSCETTRAVEVFNQGLKRFPGSLRFHKQLGWLNILVKRFDEAIEHCTIVVQEEPLAYRYYANLVTAHWERGENARAIEFGKRALSVKDRVCTDGYRAPVGLDVCYSVKPLQVSRPRISSRVISFSLWGDQRTYTQGAVINAELARELYPKWVCRFYCAKSVPESVRTKLQESGAQVYLMPESVGGYEGAIWRFFVADDTEVERYVCRDCDSRLNEQEKAAVCEWIESGKSFHIMRDAIVHCDLMLAGLWGGIQGKLPPVQALFKRSFSGGDGRFADQDFLAQNVWPLIKDDALVHDTYYQYGGGKPFPPDSMLERPQHVGAGFRL